MPKAMQIQDDQGQPLAAFNFGEVAADEYSRDKPIVIVNTGDMPLTGVRAWIEQSLNAKLRVSIAGRAIVGTNLESATALPDLPVGKSYGGFAQYAGPDLPVETGILRLVSD